MSYSTYRVEPVWKKAVEETFTYSHPDYEDVIEVEETYRWGEYDITPTNDEELDALLNRDDDEPFCPFDFKDCEVIELYDQSYRDAFSGMDEDAFETLREETDEFDAMTLEELGWSPEFQTRIYAGVTVEKNDDIES